MPVYIIEFVVSLWFMSNSNILFSDVVIAVVYYYFILTSIHTLDSFNLLTKGTRKFGRPSRDWEKARLNTRCFVRIENYMAFNKSIKVFCQHWAEVSLIAAVKTIWTKPCDFFRCKRSGLHFTHTNSIYVQIDYLLP